jgi:uncharacterized protein (TIGR00255 family)
MRSIRAIGAKCTPEAAAPPAYLRSMIRSMTGFGKASGPVGDRTLSAEVRSLNGKQLDLGVRTPSAFRDREADLRRQVSGAVLRGKCDVALSFELEAGEVRTDLNRPVIDAYLDRLQAIARDRGLPQEGLIAAALRLPDAVSTPREAATEAEWTAALALVASALEAFDAFRLQEGATLDRDLRGRIAAILELESGLDALLAARHSRILQRIRTNLEEAIDRSRIDENRFEQEVLFYLEKMDVSEERVRLTAHCAYFLETLSAGGEAGKPLGFIAQEIGREINTLGSKANDAEIQRRVVRMTDELEKVKEQVLNVL